MLQVLRTGTRMNPEQQMEASLFIVTTVERTAITKLAECAGTGTALAYLL